MPNHRPNKALYHKTPPIERSAFRAILRRTLPSDPPADLSPRPQQPPVKATERAMFMLRVQGALAKAQLAFIKGRISFPHYMARFRLIRAIASRYPDTRRYYSTITHYGDPNV